MKAGAKTSEEPPSPSDLEGWRGVVASGRLRLLRPEHIVAAIQHIGANGDQRVLAATDKGRVYRIMDGKASPAALDRAKQAA
jgi:hypothetical protein